MFEKDIQSSENSKEEGIDFKMKTLLIGGVRARIQIWDTAGQERFDTVTAQYFRRAQGVILVYDITNEASFRNLYKWINMMHANAPDNMEVLLVGNKSDAEAQRAVSKEEAENLAKSHSMDYIEVSAHQGNNIYQAFSKLAETVLRREQQLRNERVNSLQRTNGAANETVSLDTPEDGRSSECRCFSS
ncbi:putative ras-related protein [Apostichopus japonicus]|uniref:Putative ras-related protein n=1 Tax=Stichopus japonicus TaxID=307972 RepID=A0A2G8L4M1_STIJA|nr:putative ras-related protein [Apostichopus japonicus]